MAKIKVCDLAKELGMNASMLSYRMKRGMTFQQAIECDKHFVPAKKKRGGVKEPKLYTYNGETKSVNAWAKAFGLNQPTLNARLNKGMSFEEAISIPKHARAGA